MPTELSLPPALGGFHNKIESVAGGLSLYSHGAGRPLLLVHSVNAAASAAEVRPLYERYSAKRRVYALELPGFGRSDRTPRPYTVRLLTDAIHATISHIHAECPNQSIDALAVSLACEFLARAAVERNDLRSVALVSPTGFNRSLNANAPRSGAPEEPLAHKILVGPGWGGPLFRLLTRPGVIRYFLERTWGSPRIDERLWRYDVVAARQAGAEHAPLYFLSGALFSRDIVGVYQRLTCPVWMSRGTRGDFVNYRNAALVEALPNWRHSVFTTGALPYFETLEEFGTDYDSFLEQAAWRYGGTSVCGPSTATASA